MSRDVHTGVVGKGEERATKLGFPTINIPLTDTASSGVYAAKVNIENGVYPAVAFADQKRGLLEAHLLGFSGDLYGKNVAIELLEKIRDAMRFETDKELVHAIAGDAAKAREYFTRHS